MNRAETWYYLSGVNKELLLALYGSPEGFLEAEVISPLEPYILAFDHVMGEEGYVRQLARRIGADVPPLEDASVYLYWVLKEAIRVYGPTGEIGKGPNLGDIINMQESEFSRRRGSQGGAYHQRLILYMDETRVGL
jgi:hypothetical protein